jgi:hypothetical protein
VIEIRIVYPLYLVDIEERISQALGDTSTSEVDDGTMDRF